VREAGLRVAAVASLQVADFLVAVLWVADVRVTSLPSAGVGLLVNR
jgi:hypothetical protein